MPDPGDVAFPWATVVPVSNLQLEDTIVPTNDKCSEWHCRQIWAGLQKT